jgi:hypothetical protein
MRVPVVFFFRVLLAVCLCVQPVVCAAGEASPPAADLAAMCEQTGYSWSGPNGVIVVDRRKTEHLGIRDVTYRLDDANGYWIFPPSTTLVSTLAPPPNAGTALNLSIAQLTTDHGVVETCAPSIRGVASKPPADVPSTDGPDVSHLVPTSHTDDSITCEDPFVVSHVVKAVAPNTPALAALNHVTGEVFIRVRLDPAGQLVSADVIKSPSSLLDRAAVASAHLSQYSPSIFRCRPIASDYIFIVDFEAS